MSNEKGRKIISPNDVLSYYVLSAFAVIYAGMIFYEKAHLAIMIVAAVLTGIVISIGFVNIHKIKVHRLYGFLEHYTAIIACALGAVATYFISVNLEFGPVIGAGLTGMAAYYLCHFHKTALDLPPAAYCGAFVGMASPFVLPNLIFVSVSGLIAGVLYYLSHDAYSGVGGKLGTIAFSSVVVTVLIKIGLGMIL
ncbi:hypothetical protein JXC34_02540 [Candidatus Woesearchaeota archaeon]|nr:hypothetical protein [Candidatus Woesearchaeota archaeon]